MVGLSDIPFLGKALDIISEKAVEASSRGLSYLFCYKSIVNNLNSQIEKVQVQEDRVSRKISQEKANGKTIENHVDKWQKQVQEIKACADKLVQHRHSWNPVTRFRLGRKAAHEAKNVAEVTLAGEKLLESEIAFHPADPNIPISDTTYQKFDSRKGAYEMLWKALVKEDGHQIIGIYGMAGVGKTRMTEQVWKDAIDKNVFNKVIRAIVGGEKIDVIKLQNQLAGYLGCRLESIDNEDLRAYQLKRSLITAGKSLVILDDLWDPITLQNIGIPLGDDISKCKILLTSRKEDVCLRSGCAIPIKLEALTSAEAWDMFKKYVDTSKIHSALAEKVCKECGGLPLLIQALGNALKYASENSWKDALSQLQMGDLGDLDGIDSRVYTCIKLSFDKIGKAEKSCLLLCSVFPEDAEIEIKMLEDFATGSQLLPRGRNVNGLVDKLKSASLLLEGKTRQTVKLHDIIRDVARSVAARDEHYAFFFIRGDLRLPDIDDCSSRKLLQYLESDNFSYPIDMACPNLHTLWLECDKKPPQFSNSFFKGIGSLKILVLKDRHAFPEQLFVQSFDKLSYLILDGCALNKAWLNFVPENLETLRISKCHLPNPLDLSKLRCLRKLEVLCDSKIDIKMSTLPTTLAELHIPGGFRICNAEGKISSTPISRELNKLNGLKSLNIRLEDSESCPNENIVDDLLDFIIFVGDERDWRDSTGSGVWTVEKSVEINRRCIEGGVKVLVERAERVILENVKGSWKGFSDKRRHAFLTLKWLTIINCSEMEHVVAYTPQNEIHQIQPLTPFSNLTDLVIRDCHELKYLFSAAVVRCLVQLKGLYIEDCRRLEEVVIRKESVIDDDGTIIYFPKLKRLNLEHLPNLRRFYGEKRSSTTLPEDAATIKPAGSYALFDGTAVFSSLEELTIEHVNTSEIWGRNCWNHNSFGELKSLYISKCPNLEFGISIAMLPTFQNLKELQIWGCKSVVSEVEISRSESESESSNPPTLVALRYMRLVNLPGLTQTGLNSKRTNFIYPILDKLFLYNCSSLRNVFSPSIAKHLEKCLEELDVIDCGMMSEIIGGGGGEEKEGERLNQFVFPHLTRLHLEYLLNFKSLCFSDSKTLIQNDAPTTVRLFHQMVVLPSIQTLIIADMNISEIWEINCCNDNSFGQLKSLEIRNCHHLEFAIPLVMWPRFQNLEKLNIGDCNSLVSEVESSSSSPELTPLVALRSIELSHLPVLTQTRFNSCNRNLYPNLQTLDIRKCNSLKNVFLPSTVKNLVRLRELKVTNCEMMSEIIGEEEKDGETNNEFLFPELTHLELDTLPNFKRFCFGESVEALQHQSYLASKVSFPKLVSLKFNLKTIKFEEIEVGRNDSISEIKKLVVESDNKLQLPLKLKLQFPNIEELTLKNCWWHGNFCIFSNRCIEGEGKFLVDRAEEVIHEDVQDSPNGFSNSNYNRYIQAFSNMTKLSIQSCEGMHHVACIPHFGNQLSQPHTAFSILTSLEINKCSGLKYLFSASVAKCLVELQLLHIENCPILEVVIRNEGAIHELIIFPKLSSLMLWNLGSLRRFYVDTRVITSSSTTIIENAAILPDASESPLDGMVSFPNIEILKFNVNGVPNCFSNSNIDAFPNLKKLFIRSREDMENLACRPPYEIQQSQPPFSKLSKLFIHKCSGLKYLFCDSIVKCLVQLRHLWIIDCPALEAIIRTESTNDDVIISFPNLEQLKLYFLPSLRSFYRENRGTASLISTTTMENASNASYPSESLFDGTVAFPSLKLLSMKALERSEIWGKNCYKTKHFSCLKSLEILHCHNLEFAIPLAMLPTFQNLKWLKISKCDSMSEIIRKEENQGRNYELVFPELTKLQLKNLPNFKSFCFNEFVEAQAASLLHQFHLVTKVSLPKLLKLEVYVKAITLDEIELSQSDSTFELKKLKVRCGNKVQLPYKWQLKLPNVKELCLESCWWHGSSGEHNVEQFLINPYKTLSFQNLEAVEVRSCGLSALFSCSVFINLRQLKKLKVRNCPLLEEVVREDDNVVGTSANTISLLNLKSIEFKNLPKLKSFSRSSRYAFNFPALKSIVLRNCPQMEKFTCLEISTQSMPDFDSQIQKYLNNPGEGSEEDSSDADSDKEDIVNFESFMEKRFDDYS